MGVIQRQGAKNSIVQYVGVLIGALSTLLIYPLDYSAYGLAQTIIDLVIFLTPIVTLGTISLSVRFFARFTQGADNDNGFLGFLLLTAGAAFILFGLVAFLLGDTIIHGLSLLKFDLSLFVDNWVPLLVFVLVYVVLMIFDNYIRNYNRIVVQSIFTNLLPKIGLPILILLVFYGYIDTREFIWGLIAVYALGALGLIIYAKQITPFSFKINRALLQPPLLKEMRSYAAYAVFGSMGVILATQLDSLMISTLIDTTNTGIYKITAFMAVVIEIPARALRAIASPIVAKAWEEKDYEEIKKIYNRSSAVLGFLGTGIFVLLLVNIADIISWTPQPAELMSNLGVFYILGLVRLVDLFTGINSQIITYSDHYRFNIYAILLLAVFNVVFNYLFIVSFGWGILGVAAATFLSMTLYNFAKFMYLKIRLQLQPFTWETLKIILVGVVGVLLGSAFDLSFPTLVNVILRSLLVGSLLLGAVWYLGICPEIKEALQKYVGMLLAFFRKEGK